MIPQRFAASNIVMQAPKDMENCAHIHAFSGKTQDGQSVTITAWRPRPEDMVRIALGEPIWLYIYGKGMPPVALETTDPFSEQTKEE